MVDAEVKVGNHIFGEARVRDCSCISEGEGL